MYMCTCGCLKYTCTCVVHIKSSDCVCMLCVQLRLWVLTLGFTLSFGALFAKTWQVYRVYTNNELKKNVCVYSVCEAMYRIFVPFFFTVS